MLQKVIDVVLAPFESWAAFFTELKRVPFILASLRSQTGWLYLLSSLIVAFVVFRIMKKHGDVHEDASFQETVFPRDVYMHRSAIMDYKFVFFDKTVRYFLYVPLFSAITYKIYSTTTARLGPGPVHLPERLAFWLIPIFALLVTDLSLYISHYAMHRVRFLWPFHEVHHSAEVLTPATSHRIHPVEELVTTSIQSLFTGVGAALLASAADFQINHTTIFGLNFVMFGFYLFGFQLRHSHVWLSYGPLWSRVFISPAQHQIHHSEARKHWDKNFGFVFAFWDLAFGSLYVPKQREPIVFGCGANPEDYSTLPRMYFKPFVYSYQVFRDGIASRIGRLRGSLGDTPTSAALAPAPVNKTAGPDASDRTPIQT